MDYEYLTLAEKGNKHFILPFKKLALAPLGAQYQLLKDGERIRAKERLEK